MQYEYIFNNPCEKCTQQRVCVIKRTTVHQRVPCRCIPVQRCVRKRRHLHFGTCKLTGDPRNAIKSECAGAVPGMVKLHLKKKNSRTTLG